MDRPEGFNFGSDCHIVRDERRTDGRAGGGRGVVDEGGWSYASQREIRLSRARHRAAGAHQWKVYFIGARRRGGAVSAGAGSFIIFVDKFRFDGNYWEV